MPTLRNYPRNHHKLLVPRAVTSEADPQGRVDADGCGDVVVLHPDHDLLIHGEPGRFPHRHTNGREDQERRGPGQADQDQVWHLRSRLHRFLFQG